MARKVEVAIIGAGTSGLNAMGQARRAGKSFVLINGGELGTTCARVGCMPSKALIQVAEDFHRRKILDRYCIDGGDGLTVDIPEALEYVRDMRDLFVDRVLQGSTDEMGDEFIEGYARFVAPNRLEVDGEEIEAEKVVIATGSTPIVPKPWRVFGDRIVTTDEFFELESLPSDMAVIGLGVIGIELGQSLARLGINVVGVDALEQISGLSDPVVNADAIKVIGKEFPLWLGHPAELSEGEDGKVRVQAGEQSVEVDKVLVSIGRRPYLDYLGLENLGIELNERGLPDYDPHSMQVGDLPIFLAGDVNGDAPILHEAGAEGKIAGFNAAQDSVTQFSRNPMLAITFSDPNIVNVGQCWPDLAEDPDVVVGEMPIGPVGRALIMGKNKGIIRVYANRHSGQLLGGSMIAPKGESLGHILAWAIQQKLSVFDTLALPFYHPTLEEALQGALQSLISKLEQKPDIPVGLRKIEL